MKLALVRILLFWGSDGYRNTAGGGKLRAPLPDQRNSFHCVGASTEAQRVKEP